MCNIWQHPTLPDEEITAADLRTLPKLKFINITGGEPFVRDDLAEIVEECYRHAPRIVISTSGWFSDRIIELARQFPNIGIRISIEGVGTMNDTLRGREGGYQRGFDTVEALRKMGVKDVGIACTIGNENSADMLKLHDRAEEMKIEFATAAVHNSYYFHKNDNKITDIARVSADIEQLVVRQLKERNPKSWFRAYFNMGFINYISGAKRLIPCESGTTNFFINPTGEVYPCNGIEEHCRIGSMGNTKEQPFDLIWHSERADEVRRRVASCPKNCWMIGSVAPVMKKHFAKPAKWVIKNKLRVACGMAPKFINGDKRQ